MTCSSLTIESQDFAKSSDLMQYIVRLLSLLNARHPPFCPAGDWGGSRHISCTQPGQDLVWGINFGHIWPFRAIWPSESKFPHWRWNPLARGQWQIISMNNEHATIIPRNLICFRFYGFNHHWHLLHWTFKPPTLSTIKSQDIYFYIFYLQ